MSLPSPCSLSSDIFLFSPSVSLSLSLSLSWWSKSHWFLPGHEVTLIFAWKFDIRAFLCSIDRHDYSSPCLPSNTARRWTENIVIVKNKIFLLHSLLHTCALFQHLLSIPMEKKDAELTPQDCLQRVKVGEKCAVVTLGHEKIKKV